MIATPKLKQRACGNIDTGEFERRMLAAHPLIGGAPIMLWRAGMLVALRLPLAVLLAAPPAAAHATLLATTPPAGYAGTASPRQVTLDFDEPVSVAAPALTLPSPGGRPVALSAPTLSVSDRRLSAEAPPITGERFITGEPSAAGGADGAQAAFAFPAQGFVVRPRLAPDDRIVRKVLLTPKDLITRTVDYGRDRP